MQRNTVTCLVGVDEFFFNERIDYVFTGEPVKVLVTLFITSLGGLDEREMVRREFYLGISLLKIVLKHLTKKDCSIAFT